MKSDNNIELPKRQWTLVGVLAMLFLAAAFMDMKDVSTYLLIVLVAALVYTGTLSYVHNFYSRQYIKASVRCMLDKNALVKILNDEIITRPMTLHIRPMAMELTIETCLLTPEREEELAGLSSRSYDNSAED